jgi:hypothetical protein
MSAAPIIVLDEHEGLLWEPNAFLVSDNSLDSMNLRNNEYFVHEDERWYVF